MKRFEDPSLTGEGLVVVDLAALGFRGRPFRPAAGGIEGVGIFFPFQFGFGGFVGFEGIEVFQEQEPGTLLGVIHSLVHPASFQRTSSMFLKVCSNIRWGIGETEVG
ncbi:MAG: hypothetical protein MUF86_07520 [Akkermansiaceae bacterium]|jgi:hypothetical protein|nr:hypothetical protein [Akkermansiaceae bacterium]MCU0777502.1 hypothetical protein [Akkermansiaceae bacterium]